MKNISLALMVLTTLSLNIASAQAVNKPIQKSISNELHSNQNKITNSTSIKCYWLPIGIPVCR